MEETIGQFAKRVGTTVRTLRYYDSIGLLEPAGRNAKEHKLYAHKEWERYQQILVCKHLGMSLEETKKLLDDSNISPQAMLELQKSLLKKKRDELDEVLETIDRTEQLYQVDEIQSGELDDLLFVMLDAFRRERAQMKVFKEHFSKEFYDAFFRDYDNPSIRKKLDIEVAYFYKEMKRALKEERDASSEEVQNLIQKLFSLFPRGTSVEEFIHDDAFFNENQALFAIHFPKELDAYIQKAMAIYYKMEGIEVNGR